MHAGWLWNWLNFLLETTVTLIAEHAEAKVLPVDVASTVALAVRALARFVNVGLHAFTAGPAAKMRTRRERADCPARPFINTDADCYTTCEPGRTRSSALTAIQA